MTENRDQDLNSDQPSAGGATDHLTLALRVGLHQHAQFAGAIHERVIAAVLYETPLAQLTVSEIRSAVAARFDGLTLPSAAVRKALGALQQRMLAVESRHGTRGGEPTFTLSATGQEVYSAARSDGDALLSRVKREFARRQRIADERQIDERWGRVLTALDAALRESAYDISLSLIDGAALPQLGARDGQAGADLASLLQGASGDTLTFLRRAVNGALGYYLFRAAPDADAQVRQHLANRTFYLDTTVLYSLATGEPDFIELRDDLLRLVRTLRCRMKVTRATLCEFQSSVAYYKRRVREGGPMSRPIAIAVLTGHPSDTLDDFTRGFYRALAADESMTLDLFAQRCELIEDQLQKWGVTIVRDPDDESELGVPELQSSLREYLESHPRARSAEGPRDEQVRHDALLVALVRRERAHRGIAFATQPSQVGTWFLTRDRRVRRWDAERARTSGDGRIPNCIALDEWIESMMLFDPSLSANEAAGSAIVRLIAQNAPPLSTEESPHVRDLLEIGREAEALKLHPSDAARLAADRELLHRLAEEPTKARRVDAIQAAALANKDLQIDALGETLTEIGEQLETVNKEKGKVENSLSTLRDKVANRDQRTAEIRRERRQRRQDEDRERQALQNRLLALEDAAGRLNQRRRFSWRLLTPSAVVVLVTAWWTTSPQAPGARQIDWRVRTLIAALIVLAVAAVIDRKGKSDANLREWWPCKAMSGVRGLLTVAVATVILGFLANEFTRGAEAQQEKIQRSGAPPAAQPKRGR